jgi:hypothetical protein
MNDCSLPFSVHLAYAIIAYVSFLAHGGPENARESTREAELALLKEGDGGDDIGTEAKNEEQAQRSVADELRLPPRGKLLPNYIFQLVFPLILWLMRNMSSSSWNKSGLLYVLFHTLYPLSIVLWLIRYRHDM